MHYRMHVFTEEKTQAEEEGKKWVPTVLMEERFGPGFCLAYQPVNHAPHITPKPLGAWRSERSDRGKTLRSERSPNCQRLWGESERQLVATRPSQTLPATLLRSSQFLTPFFSILFPRLCNMVVSINVDTTYPLISLLAWLSSGKKDSWDAGLCYKSFFIKQHLTIWNLFDILITFATH